MWLGSYNTRNDAKDAYIKTKLELDSQNIGCSRNGDVTKRGYKQSEKRRRSRPRYVYRRKPGRWQTEIRNPITKARVDLGDFETVEEAEEAYNSKSREFDSMISSRKKRKQSDDIAEGVLDSDGRLIGKYSRLDDELWLC